MKFGMKYEQGEIIVVLFPFSDLKGVRQRPVLILSKKIDSDDVITCGITSNLKNTKHSVLINNEDLEKGNIPTQSRFKVDKLFTLDKKIIRKKIAKLNKITLENVKKEFYKLV